MADKIDFSSVSFLIVDKNTLAAELLRALAASAQTDGPVAGCNYLRYGQTQVREVRLEEADTLGWGNFMIDTHCSSLMSNYCLQQVQLAGPDCNF